uniref:ATP-binding protein n=1 Tax=Streptomyces blattellae TaxID=2569855 RepID=UPI0038B4D9E1
MKKGLPLCLIGDSGTGKSHLMIALGTEAARHGRVDLLCIDLSRRCDYAGNGARLGHNRTVVRPVRGNPGARSGLEMERLSAVDAYVCCAGVDPDQQRTAGMTCRIRPCSRSRRRATGVHGWLLR